MLFGGSFGAESAARASPNRYAAVGSEQKNYKDRGEYELYSKITQTQDPNAKLKLLNTWQDEYPQSDFAQDRLLYYVLTLSQLAPSDPPSRQKLIDKCNELLKVDPKNFRAMYLISLWGPAVGGASPSPDLLSQVDSAAHGTIENADTAFDVSKKPANVNEADFTKAKSQSLGIAHDALAWAATAKKDNATAENEYKASLRVNPDQGRISYLYAKLLQEEKKYPEALFEYARAAQYTGPDAIPASAQPQVLDYYKKVYGQFHGTLEGADRVLLQASANALPPTGFTILEALVSVSVSEAGNGSDQQSNKSVDQRLPPPTNATSATWQAGIAEVIPRQDLGHQPGTAFIVAIQDGNAFLVTSAHVVEGDPNPEIEFAANPRKRYKCTVRGQEYGDKRGLALLVVSDPPSEVRALPPSNSPKPVLGETVTVAGYPASVGFFTVESATVANLQGRDIFLDRETSEGFSGGPVLRNGTVLGLVFGRQSGFGLAARSEQI